MGICLTTAEQEAEYEVEKRSRETGRAPMTALPDDPGPTETTGVDAGDVVHPGDTPPDSSQTSASANKNPPPTSGKSPTMIAALIAAGVIFAIFLTVAVLYFLQVIGVMDRW